MKSVFIEPRSTLLRKLGPVIRSGEASLQFHVDKDKKKHNYEVLVK